MRKVAASLFLMMCFGWVFGDTAEAQRRRRSGGARPSASSAARRTTTTAARAAQVEEVRGEVANQINNLTRFLYSYGRIARDLDRTTADARAAAREANQRGVTVRPEAVERNKAQVVQNFNNLRAGLDALDEKMGRVTELARLRPELSNARTATLEATQLATAERFDDAGRRLVNAVESLTNVLRQFR